MDDKTPAQAEAEDETIAFDWLGETIQLPASSGDWDINVTRAFARGDILTAIEGLVGPTVFARIEKAHRKANGGTFRNRDVKPLGDKVAELYGLGSAGE